MESRNAWFLTDAVAHESGRGDPFAAAIRATRMPMVISNPRLPDNPLVFVNEAFCRLTGYARDDILGRNCRFLQGPETSRDVVRRISDAVLQRTDINAEILNYRKDGSTFWNALYMSPVFNNEGELQFFFASQLDVTEHYTRSDELERQRGLVEREVQARTRELKDALDAKDILLHEVDHRVKNNLQMVSSLLAMQITSLRGSAAAAPLLAMQERVQALGAVHRRLHQSDDVSRLHAPGLVNDIVDELRALSGREDIRFMCEVDDFELDAVRATPIALLLNELLTNAMKHGFPDGRAGEIVTTLRAEGAELTLVVADDGVGSAGSKPGFGSRLTMTLARQLGGQLETRSDENGTEVRLTLPRRVNHK